MGSVNTNFLPASTGLTLGNANQLWTAYLQDVFSTTVLSNSANPALTGFLRLASTDFIAWRNNANAADVTLSKTGAASGTTPADTLVFSGSGIEGPFLSHNANPASAGEIRLGSTDALYFRNNTNSADILGIQHNTDDSLTIGGTAGIVVPGGLSLSAIGSLNNILFVDGVKYTTLAAALAALPASGGEVVLPPGYSETITSTTVLGSATSSVLVRISNRAKLTVNITDGSSWGFSVYSGSGFVGENFAAPGDLPGSLISVPATFNGSGIIRPALVTGATATLLLSNVVILVSSGATISNAIVSLEGITGPSVCRDVHIGGTGAVGIGWHIKGPSTGTFGGTQNIILDNCSATSCAQPMLIETSSSGGVEDVVIIGGFYNNPTGTAACIEINGQGVSGGALNQIHLHNVHVEARTGTAGTSNVGLLIKDAYNVAVHGLRLSGTTGSDAVQIAESVAGYTRAIRLENIVQSSNGANSINNTINSEALTAARISSYAYSRSNDSASIWSDEAIAGVLSIGGATNMAKGVWTFKNAADATESLVVDSGLTSTQGAQVSFSDQGVTKWSFGKNNGNQAIIFDGTNSKTRMKILQSATGATVDCSRLGVGQSTNLVAGDFSPSGNWGTTPTITVVGGKDGAGSITVLAQATTGANPTLTLTFHDGTWTTVPVVTACRTDAGIAPTTCYWAVTSVTATQVIFTFIGTPTAGNTYGLAFTCVGT